MTDRVLPSEELADSIIELLSDTSLAANECELSRLVRLPLREQFAVAVLVNAEGVERAQGALDSMVEREEAHTKAMERRSRFVVVGEP